MYFSFLKKYRWLFGLILFLILLVESSRVIEKFLFKAFIDHSTDFAAHVIDKPTLISAIMQVVTIFVIVVVLKSIVKWTWHHLLNLLETDMIARVKQKLFNHIVGLSYNFHTTNKTGSLISRLLRGGHAVEKMTDILVFNVAPLIFQLALVTGSLWYFEWKAAVSILVTIVTYIIYSFGIQQWQREANIAANDAEDDEKAHVSDMLMNVDSIKYFGKEKSVNRRFAKISRFTSDAFRRHWNFFRWLDPAQSIILAIGTFLLLYFPFIAFLDGKITVGTLTFAYVIFTNLWGPLFGFVHGMREFYRVMADFESLFQYTKVHNEVKDKENAKNLRVRKGSVEFKNVTFAYHKQNLFEDFNLKIKPNTKVALVGHSGCGKTSLIRLLYRLFDLHDGQILIDDKDIASITKESLRSQLSIVPQECILFDDTVYNNVAFSRPGASRKEVLAAMKFAQLDKVMAHFPRKDKTIVGERGVKLSGGEKQRVSIARALLANKKILVLDEATSALDSKTEHEIQQDLENLMKGRTSIIIAHRLSTIMKADKIVVMESGKIVQMGSHKELIKQKGNYKNLWNLQKGGYLT